MRKGGAMEARKLLPIAARLKAELEAARAEDSLLEEFLQLQHTEVEGAHD
ncbi:hypothetical protein [uncultured Devosia sp.]